MAGGIRQACGDFIPEKILGVGVVGKYAYLNPLDDGQFEALDVAQHNMHEWVRRHSNSGELATTVPTLPQLDVPTEENASDTRQDPLSLSVTRDVDSSETASSSAAAVTESKLVADTSEDDPANVVSDEKISASSTIETVMSLHSSMLLVRVDAGVPTA